MKKMILTASMIVFSAAFGQNLLTDDTLFIGSVSGLPGEQIVLPIIIKTTGVYQGWQIPLKFGGGSAPLRCDSVSIANSCMSSIPHEWDFVAPFVNNHQWDGVQTCGIAGVVDMAPPYEWLPPGGYRVMDIYFTIDPGAQAQTIAIDTAASRWYSGGPINAYVISENYQSWTTIVVPGALQILQNGAAEGGSGEDARGIAVFPSHVKKGQTVTLALGNGNAGAGSVAILDAGGRACPGLIRGREGSTLKINTAGLPGGAYFVLISTSRGRRTAKFVVE